MTRRKILFTLWTIQGLAALVWLAMLPTDNDHAILFGFSASRLALLGIVFALTIISAILALFQSRLKLTPSLAIQSYLPILSIVVTLSAPTIYFILHALGETSGYIYSAYAGRLAPLLFWFTLSALELIIHLAITSPETKASKNSAGASRQIFLVSLYTILALVVITTLILVTGLGITPSNDGSWGSPATPLLEWQIVLVLILTLVLLTQEQRWRWLKNDRLLFWCIYLVTCLLWLSQPIKPGFFATPPRAPNFEIYPFSDALIYAQYAQSALIGNGFMWPDVPTRPLYIAFITWLHALAGQDYTHVIALQTIVLAFFPPILYLLGKELAGRPVGIGLALLAAFRDLTANVAAPFALNYTYTKLFFSEIPAALLICLFSLLAIRWMRRPGQEWIPLIIGAILGLSSLIRLQSAVLLAAIFPISFFVIKNHKKWLWGSILMTIGFALALTPWLVRNFKATGGIVLDNPISQSMVLARRWGGDNGNELIPHLPGENEAEYSSRMGRMAFNSLLANPGGILHSATNHFLNNEIGNLLVFPLREQLNSPGELLWPEHAFWQTWQGQPTAGQVPIILFYMGLFGLGLSAAWQKNGLTGLAPLAISLVYNAWTALFLSSGDRFLVPVDWAAYFYLFLGLFTLASLIFRSYEPFSAWILSCNIETAGHENTRRISWFRISLAAAVILIIAVSIPLTEVLFPRKYPVADTAKISSAEVVSLRGRAIYPRWYKAGEGEPGTAKLGYASTDKARLVFFMVGEQNTLVIFQLKTAPKFFPNASDVLITGNLHSGYLQAQKITVQKNGTTIEYLP
jgi:hypothetical protein